MKALSWQLFFRSLAEDLPLEEVVDEVRDFDERFGIILRRHIAVLGWWCVLNLIVSIPVLWLFDNWLWYFVVMNLSWAVINFGIVLKLYDHIFYRRFLKGSVFQRFEVQRHVEKMLLLNIGLDLSYFFIGLYLKTLSYVPDIGTPDLWYGFGWSVMLQGTYLFVHDFSFHLLHVINFRKCKPFLEKQLLGTEVGVSA